MLADAGRSLDPKGRKILAYRWLAGKALAPPCHPLGRSYMPLKGQSEHADGGRRTMPQPRQSKLHR